MSRLLCLRTARSHYVGCVETARARPGMQISLVVPIPNDDAIDAQRRSVPGERLGEVVNAERANP